MIPRYVRVCMCVCVVIPFILDVSLVDVPAGVTQEEGHTGFLHLPSAVLALTFLARRIQPLLPLVESQVELCVLTNYLSKNPSSCDCTEIRTHVPTSEGFEVTNWTTGDQQQFYQSHPYGYVVTATLPSRQYVCMYVCMVITDGRVWIDRVRLPILLVVSLTWKISTLPCPHSRLRIESRDTGSVVPFRTSLPILHTQAECRAYSRDSSRFRRVLLGDISVFVAGSRLRFFVAMQAQHSS